MTRKVWSAGEVLTAADVNNYLMDQEVIRFASVAERDAQWTNPPEGAMCITTDLAILWQRINSVWQLPAGSWCTAIPQGVTLGSQVTATLTLASQQQMKGAGFKRTADNLGIITTVPGPVRVTLDLYGTSPASPGAGTYLNPAIQLWRSGASALIQDGFVTSPGATAPCSGFVNTSPWLLLANDQIRVQAWGSNAGWVVNASKSRLIIERLYGLNSYEDLTT